jgi:16S rRNA (guanine527-N7)-methyltransferase
MNNINKYFPNLTDKQRLQFEQLQTLYAYWNAQINVISRKDIDNLYLNHVLHSLSIAKLLSFKNQTTVLDVGTGGGFPGIPLAILFPNALFHLVDSIGKKIKVAQNVADALELENVECTKIRAEELTEEYDFVVSRAVTALPEFYQWVSNRIAKTAFNAIPNGILYLKGGDISEELKPLPRKAAIHPISDWFSEDYFQEKYVIHIPFGKKPQQSEY